MKLNENLYNFLFFRFAARKSFLIPVILGLTSFAIYIFTMPPSIYTGDSGEIATAVYTWGIPHPTGFPVYIILAKSFSYLLPWLEFAHRLNIFSALISSITLVILFFILRKLGVRYSGSLAASLSLAFGYTFWAHAETLQVYSLTAFFFVLTILIFLHWLKIKKDFYFYILAVVSSMGTGTHLTFLLIFPFIFIFILTKDKTLITAKRIFLFAIIFAVMTVIIYNYIPIRAAQLPEFNWGNPSNKENFIYYITQRDWAFKMSNRNFGSWRLMLNETLGLFSREFTRFGLIFILIGVASAFIKNRPFLYAGLSVIFFNILLMGNYGNIQDMDKLWRYFLPSYIVMAAFLAIAIDGILKLFRKYINLTISDILAALIIPAVIFAIHADNLNRHNNFLVLKITRDIFEILPQRSILFIGGDTFSGVANYTQLVLKERRDLLILDVALITRPWYKEQKKKEIEKRGLKYANDVYDFIINNKNERIFSLLHNDSLIKISDDFFPEGLVFEYQIKNKKESANLLEIKQINDKFWQNRNLEFLQDTRIDKDPSLKEIVMLYTSALSNLGVYLVNNGLTKEGVSYLEKSLNIRENELALYDLMEINNILGNQKKSSDYKNRLNVLKK